MVAARAWTCWVKAAESGLDSIWIWRIDGNYVFEYESENSFPTDGAKLMEHKFVSKSEQMESLVECEGLLDEGHRCGACHEVSDAKVRIIIKYSSE